MKGFVKKNWKGILFGYGMAITIMNILQIIEAIILKIAIIING